MDVLSTYVKESKRVPLLTSKQEHDIFRSFIGCFEIQEKNHLCIICQEPKHRVISANLRLVISLAIRNTRNPMNLIDNIQNGNEGLIKAVDKFDYRKGNRFSTYACWWIKSYIMRGIPDQTTATHIPVQVCDSIKQINAFQQSTYKKTGRKVSLEDIARKLDMDVPYIIRCINASCKPVYMDSPVGMDDSTTLKDIMVDGDQELPDYAIIASGLRRKIRETVATKCNPREQTVIIRYYGLTKGISETLDAIGGSLGITRERVRQIKNKALKKLKQSDLSLVDLYT
jgi:RNA polymerase primary sigma factor